MKLPLSAVCLLRDRGTKRWTPCEVRTLQDVADKKSEGWIVPGEDDLNMLLPLLEDWLSQPPQAVRHIWVDL